MNTENSNASTNFKEVYDNANQIANASRFFFVAKTNVLENGDIEVSVIERYREGLITVDSVEHKDTIPASKIYSYITKHCPKNRFAAVIFSGKIKEKETKCRLALEYIRNNSATDLNFQKVLKNLQFFMAVNAALRNSIHYDSPYGSGRSPYSITIYIGVYGAETLPTFAA